MRNAANKMTNPIDPCTENHFLSFIEISEQNGSLCGSHSGSLWLSLAQKALARLATSQLHSSSLSHSGTDMWILAFKIFSLPVPSRPATRSFCHYPTRSRPEVKNHYPSVSGVDPVAQHRDRSNEKSPILRTQQLVQGVPEKTTFLKLISSLIKPCCNGCSIF